MYIYVKGEYRQILEILSHFNCVTSHRVTIILFTLKHKTSSQIQLFFLHPMLILLMEEHLNDDIFQKEI